MRPLKPKDFIASVALEHNLPQEVVSEIINEYWKDVRSTLSSLEHTMVCVHNLGTFTIKHWTLDKQMILLKSAISKLDPGPRAEKRRVNMETKLKAIETIVERRKDEAQRKDFIKKHKNDRSNIQK